MAIPRHRNWYLEDFVRQNIHPDANVVDVGGESFHIQLRNILRQKGLKLRKKAGSPTIQEDFDLTVFADKSQDLVVFLNRNPGPNDLLEAARVSRMYVAVQQRGAPDLAKLRELGFKLTLTFLPLIAADDQATDDNPQVLYVLDVSQAAEEAESSFDYNVGRLMAGFDDDVRAYLAKRFGVRELPPYDYVMSFEAYGDMLLGDIESSETVGEFRDFEHFQTAVTTILVDFPNEFTRKLPPEGPSVRDSSPPGPKVTSLGSGVLKGSLSDFAYILAQRTLTAVAKSYLQGAYENEEHVRVAVDTVLASADPSRHEELRQFYASQLRRLQMEHTFQSGQVALGAPHTGPEGAKSPVADLPMPGPQGSVGIAGAESDLVNPRIGSVPEKKLPTDPVHHFELESELTEDQKLAGYSTTGWYFFDETWSLVHGPFETEEESRTKLQEYGDWLEKA